MSHDPSSIRVLTVDDHALLREGIAALVNAESDMKLVSRSILNRAMRTRDRPGSGSSNCAHSSFSKLD
jgi:hypothetical protein